MRVKGSLRWAVAHAQYSQAFVLWLGPRNLFGFTALTRDDLHPPPAQGFAIYLFPGRHLWYFYGFGLAAAAVLGGRRAFVSTFLLLSVTTLVTRRASPRSPVVPRRSWHYWILITLLVALYVALLIWMPPEDGAGFARGLISGLAVAWGLPLVLFVFPFRVEVLADFAERTGTLFAARWPGSGAARPNGYLSSAVTAVATSAADLVSPEFVVRLLSLKAPKAIRTGRRLARQARLVTIASQQLATIGRKGASAAMRRWIFFFLAPLWSTYLACVTLWFLFDISAIQKAYLAVIWLSIVISFFILEWPRFEYDRLSQRDLRFMPAIPRPKRTIESVVRGEHFLQIVAIAASAWVIILLVLPGGQGAAGASPEPPLVCTTGHTAVPGQSGGRPEDCESDLRGRK